MAKKRKKKSFKKNSCLLLFLLVILFIVFNKNLQIPESVNIIPSIKNTEEDKKQKEIEYSLCLNKPFTDEELTEDLLNLKSNIDNYIISNGFKTSVLYEDLTTGFTYNYKENEIYYGCSLIKIVDALYLINEAINNGLDLDNTTLTYTASYKVEYSSGMAKRNIGEEISLRDLITYAISVSDNTAHLMLIDYIGFSNLKTYGQSLGAKVILTGGDKFGNQTASDTNIYLKEVYRLINESEEYGPYLKSIMDNDERNAFNTEDIRIYHKYGSYDDNYHDIVLSLDERPYSISVFTLHEKSNYLEIVQGIHEKVRILHNAFYENRKQICHNEIYDN